MHQARPQRRLCKTVWVDKLNAAQKHSFHLAEQHALFLEALDTPVISSLLLSQDYIFPSNQKSPLEAVICKSGCTFVDAVSYSKKNESVLMSVSS